MQSGQEEFGEYYHRAHHIAEELLAAYQDNRSIDDQEEIKEFLRENSCSGKLSERLSSPEVHRAYYDKLKQENREKGVSLLLARIKAARRKKKRRLYIYRITAAAAVAAVAVLLLSLPSVRKEFSGSANQPPLAQQSSYPLLILGNDTTLVLSGESGKQAEGSDGIEKLEGNQLKYATARTDKTVRYHTLVIPPQYTYTVSLSDGTEVMLNAGSSLRYPVSFAGEKREVELSGEAFFKVNRAGQPFIVRIGKSEVKVYGTRFNIHSRDKDRLEIVLVEGSVGFTAKGKKEVKMTPRQLLTYDGQRQDIRIREVNPEDHILWTENRFIFKNQPLGRVLDELSVWYGIKINRGQSLENIKLTLIANKAKQPEEIFRFITEITTIKISKTRDKEYQAE